MITRVRVRQIGSTEAGELALLVQQARVTFQRLPFLDVQTAASRFSLVAHLADDPFAALMSLWPEPPYPWLDGLVVLHERLIRQAVDALLPHFLSAMGRRGARQVLVSTAVGLDAPSEMLRAILDFGFLPRAEFRRFRKAGFAVPHTRPTEATLRPLQEADLPALRHIDAVSFAPLWRYDEDKLRELFQRAHQTVVAVLDGRVIGFCCTLIDGQGVGHVQRIAVHPSYRGLAVGATLLADALRALERAGARYVELRSERAQYAAWRLYERFGFRPVGADRRVFAYDVSTARDLAA